MSAVFWIGRLRNVQRFTMHVHSHCSAHYVVRRSRCSFLRSLLMSSLLLWKSTRAQIPVWGQAFWLGFFVQCLFLKLAKAAIKSESLFLPFFVVQFVTELLHQKRKTVLDHISKHWVESWKYDAERSIFDELLGVWKRGQTLSGFEDIADHTCNIRSCEILRLKFHSCSSCVYNCHDHLCIHLHCISWMNQWINE